jgi:WD40 repeat protein
MSGLATHSRPLLRPSGGDLVEEGQVDFEGVLIRAIDVYNGKMLVGVRNGFIYEVDLATQSKTTIMESHSDGEVWGLSVVNNDQVITSGDDNKIKLWSVSKRKCEATGRICDEDRKVKRGGASTLSTFADSKCSRALAYNSSNGHIAVGHNDGTLTIRAAPDQLDNIVAQTNDAKEWIEDMEYSPDGSKLAVGSHDNKIYVYSVPDYSLLGVCKKHNSFITSVDWSLDGSYIRSVCGAYELLFFDGNSYSQDPNGASNTKGTQWATNNAKFGWLVDGIFPPGTDGSHINYVDFSKDGLLIATGDDYGLVNIFRNPALKGHKPISLRGHSEHVVRVSFGADDSYLFSIGGYDQTLMQWRRN